MGSWSARRARNRQRCRGKDKFTPHTFLFLFKVVNLLYKGLKGIQWINLISSWQTRCFCKKRFVNSIKIASGIKIIFWSFVEIYFDCVTPLFKKRNHQVWLFFFIQIRACMRSQCSLLVAIRSRARSVVGELLYVNRVIG